MPGVWSRLEDWLLALQHDRLRMTRYIQVAWWVSNAFLLLGAILILLILTRWWRP